MARKKKAPEAESIVNVTLSEIDLVAKGHELAMRVKRVNALRKQKADQAASLQELIDYELDLVDALTAQIIGGTEARNQASLKIRNGELVAPDAPFDPGAENGNASANETPGGEVPSTAAGIPPAVAAAIEASGGEVDLSAATAKNGKSKRGKVQPPKAPGVNAVTVLEPPTSCADCGSRVQMIDDSGIYACRDENALGCTWTAVVETADTAQALGASA